MFIALLSFLALAASASAQADTTTAPPTTTPPGTCLNITIKLAGNCPATGYECDAAWSVQYNVVDEISTVTCAEPKAALAVRKRIVDQAECHDGKWNADGVCCGAALSAVCAKDCGMNACPIQVRENPRNYLSLTINTSPEISRCAFATCDYGFVAVDDKGLPINEYPSSTAVNCTGTGQWSVAGTKYTYVMCKDAPKPCPYKCNDEPWQISTYFKATSPAVRDGCDYTCPAGQALSRPNGTYAVTISSASCTPTGFLTDFGITERIGCSTCDIPDGPVNRPIPGTDCHTEPGISTKCVLRCPAGYFLRYIIGDNASTCARFLAPGNVLYRQIRAGANHWVTRDGYVLPRNFRYECVKKV